MNCECACQCARAAQAAQDIPLPVLCLIWSITGLIVVAGLCGIGLWVKARFE